MGPTGPHINLTLPFCSFLAFFFWGGGSFRFCCCCGCNRVKRTTHKTKTKTQRTPAKLCSSRVWGIFGERFGKRKGKENKTKKNKNTLSWKSFLALLYLFLIVFLSFFGVSFLLSLVFLLPAFFCYFDSTQLRQNSKRKQHKEKRQETRKANK